MCAIDQKGPFLIRVGPFLGLLPFKGPFPLTGALTGRPPYGASYGEASYGEGRHYGKGRPLREMVPLTEKDDEEAYGKAGPLWEAPYRKGREEPALTGIQNWPKISASVP